MNWYTPWTQIIEAGEFYDELVIRDSRGWTVCKLQPAQQDLAETICFSVNRHLEFMEALRECFTDPGALAYEDFASAKRRIKAINETILEALTKS